MLKPFIGELRRYEAAGALTGSHALGVDGEFRGGLRLKSAFVVHLAHSNEDPGKIANLTRTIDQATVPLNGFALHRSVQLPLTVVDAFFNEYEAQGHGLKSKEIGSSLYSPTQRDGSGLNVPTIGKTAIKSVNPIDEVQKAQEIERLKQTKNIQIIEQITARSFVCVHSFENLRDGFHRFPFLLPQGAEEKFFSHRSWDMRNDNFQPHVEREESYADGVPKQRISYLPRGNELGAEPLVRTRYYWRNHPAEIEIAEEFRLFWNLFHDKRRDYLLHCDAHGTEHEVVRIVGSRVEIQLKFLVDFLRAKQMHLALQMEGAYWSRHTLEELGIAATERENEGDLFRWWFHL